MKTENREPRTETKHTPGPWHVATLGSLRVNGENDGICTLDKWPTRNGKPIGKDKSTANARLIAAAPELLEALQNLVTFPLGTFQVEAARAAIAKATGQE